MYPDICECERMNLKTHLYGRVVPESVFLYHWSFKTKNRTHTHWIERSDAIKSAYMFYRCTHNAWLLPLPLLLLLLVIVAVKLLAAFSGYTYIQVPYICNMRTAAQKTVSEKFSIDLSLSLALLHMHTYQIRRLYLLQSTLCTDVYIIRYHRESIKNVRKRSAKNNGHLFSGGHNELSIKWNRIRSKLELVEHMMYTHPHTHTEHNKNVHTRLDIWHHISERIFISFPKMGAIDYGAMHSMNIAFARKEKREREGDNEKKWKRKQVTHSFIIYLVASIFTPYTLQFAIHNNKRKSTCSKIHSYAFAQRANHFGCCYCCCC